MNSEYWKVFMVVSYVAHNPADDYPPTRPNLATMFIALALLCGVAAIMAGSTFGH